MESQAKVEKKSLLFLFFLNNYREGDYGTGRWTEEEENLFLEGTIRLSFV